MSKFYDSIKEYYRKLVGYAARRFIDRSRAQDIVQNAILKLLNWEELDHNRTPKEYKALLYNTVKKEIYNQYRYDICANRDVRKTVPFIKMNHEDLLVDNGVQSQDVVDIILREIERTVDKKSSDVFKLTVIERYKAKEVAKILGLTRYQVEHIKKKAISILRNSKIRGLLV